MIGVRLLRESLRFLESSIRKNHYVQNTHSCSKNVVIGKQPLRSGKGIIRNLVKVLFNVTYKVRNEDLLLEERRFIDAIIFLICIIENYVFIDGFMI